MSLAERLTDLVAFDPNLSLAAFVVLIVYVFTVQMYLRFRLTYDRIEVDLARSCRRDAEIENGALRAAMRIKLGDEEYANFCIDVLEDDPSDFEDRGCRQVWGGVRDDREGVNRTRHARSFSIWCLGSVG